VAEAEAGGDRTEAATPRRLERARQEGRAPVSREPTMLAVLICGGGAAAMTANGIAPFVLRLADMMAAANGHAPALEAALPLVTHAALPVAAACLLGAAAATLLQTGFLLHAGALQPQLSRIDPRTGLRRLFGTDALVEAGRSVLKLTAFLVTGWTLLSPLWPSLCLSYLRATQALPGTILSAALRLTAAAILVQALAAGFDLFWARHRHARSLRMSRQEIRQEHREAEGDPKIKARIRQIRLVRARRRMLAAVPKAAVVVTNPTHYAVALAYQRGGKGAPRVVAKGVDSMAARIREAAQAARVPLVANPPLARALYPIDLDHEIPAELYKAVAAVIAYIWRLNQRAPVR
jgi:flagellar biosynthesis protein FlhB